MTATAQKQKLEDGQSAFVIIDLSALELPLIAMHTKQIAPLESQCEAEWFYGKSCYHFAFDAEATFIEVASETSNI